METATTLLSLVAGVSGLVLAWRSNRMQTRAQALDDIDQIRQALKEENERLGKQIEHLRKKLENETLKRVALEERLEIERRVFSKRIEILEAGLKKLKHLKSEGGTS